MMYFSNWGILVEYSHDLGGGHIMFHIWCSMLDVTDIGYSVFLGADLQSGQSLSKSD